MQKFLDRIFRRSSEGPKAAIGKVDVVRTLTLPNGKKIRVLRKDVFDRTIFRTAKSKHD